MIDKNHWEAVVGKTGLPGIEAEMRRLLVARDTEIARLRAFRAAVIGWREIDHPEGFCRHTAEYMVQLGKDAE